MTELVGLSGTLALLRVGDGNSDGAHGLVLNTENLDVFDALPFDQIDSGAYTPAPSDFEVPQLWIELADAATCRLDVALQAGGIRTYAVPKSVQNEARRALSWASAHSRGGSDNAISMASKLSSGRSVTMETVRHCARYFPTKDEAEFGMGWGAHQEGFPSAQRITFSMYGGAHGRRWAQRVTAAEASNNTVMAAGDAAGLPDMDIEPVDPYAPHLFKPGDENPRSCSVCQLPATDPMHAPSDESEAAVSDVSEEADEDAPHVFEASSQDARFCALCGDIASSVIHITAGAEIAPIMASAPVLDADDDDLLDDFYSDFVIPEEFRDEGALAPEPGPGPGLDDSDATYLVDVEDGDVSDPKDLRAKTMYISMPNGIVLKWDYGMWVPAKIPTGRPLIELDEESAWEVGKSFYTNPDEAFVLSSLNPGEAAMFTMAMPEIDWTLADRIATLAQEPIYTPEERSENAQKQVRDKGGRFAKYGNNVKHDDGRTGFITKVDPTTNTVELERPDGTRETVNASEIEIVQGADEATGKPVDKGKGKVTPEPLPEGKPRVTKNTPKAWLKTLLPPMNAAMIAKSIADYEARIAAARAAARAAASAITPETTDVPPLYLAIVDELDKQAVTDLLAMVPADATGGAATVFRREDSQWVKADDLLAALKSVNPPPVVTLTDDLYQAVLAQVDSGTPTPPPGEAPVAPAEAPAPAEPAAPDVAPPAQATALMYGEFGEILPVAMTAAGGPDRNRGGAEVLRRYWTTGEGAAKIRWNSDGDFGRCVKQLSKYLGVRSRGYCSLRHKEVTGHWTGDRPRNHMSAETLAAEFGLLSWQRIPSMDDVLVASAAAVAGEGVDLKDPEQVPQEAVGITDERAGASFTIPLVLPEDLESGDGRSFEVGSLTARDMPIPLMWQITGEEGHNGSVIVGRVDNVERIENGLGDAHGVFDTGPYGQEALRLVREGMLRGISADLDQFEASATPKPVDPADAEAAEKSIGGDKLRIKAARLMGITLVAKPAFQECTILLDEANTNINTDTAPAEEPVVADGLYVSPPSVSDAGPLVAAALTAGAVPLRPPQEWFTNPNLTKPTAIEVDDDGRIFGHIAAWDVDHIGYSFGTKPPRSLSNYAYFHTGVVRTGEGKDVAVGQLTLAGGHAPMEASAEQAVRHYDDTAAAVADVHAGEDVFGIWVAGALRPGITPESVRVLRASAPSGDWRPIRGRLELVAVCQVNVPGFPITRARVASGRITALVAAGAAVLAELRETPEQTLARRVEVLEQSALAAAASAATSRVAPTRVARAAALAAQAEAAQSRMAPAVKQRQALRASAQAASARVSAHRQTSLQAAAAKVSARVAALRYRSDFVEKAHPRDDDGKFKETLFRLEADLTEAGTEIPQEALDKIHDAQALVNERSMREAKDAASDALKILDRAAADIIDPDARATASGASQELMRAIAYLPLDFENQAAKMRWSDLPSAGQALIKELLDRAASGEGGEEQAAVINEVEKWMSGSDVLSQSEFDEMVARLIRTIL